VLCGFFGCGQETDLKRLESCCRIGLSGGGGGVFLDGHAVFAV
jgi:hypothetical protein